MHASIESKSATVKQLQVFSMDIGAIEKRCRGFLEEAKKTGKPPLIVILGPTASGKTALSLELAKRLNGEIISADSRQVYRGMDIGTDKIPEEKRNGIPHHLIDVADLKERFTLVDFLENAERAIAEIHGRGKIPFLVGGTGLYISALTENFLIPETGDNLEFRKSLEKEMDEKNARGENGKKWLHQKLFEVDPETAKKIPPESFLYVLRALEIHHFTGKKKQSLKGPQKYSCLKIGLWWPREKLMERISRRAEGQFERGLLEEVQKLSRIGFTQNMSSMRSIGYRETFEYLQGKISLLETKRRIAGNTGKYARRQMTWFKRDPEILWIDAEKL